MHESDLPIAAALPALRAALCTGHKVVLKAPPGAGKSTVVPLALLDEAWLRGKRIVMLEPRRLAARAVAARMARSLREKVGETVGLRMRLDTRVSARTRVEVVTEGVLARMLQRDPGLEGVALVIFDEFHERSVQADLGLALALDAREAFAPELKLLVMSATLEMAPVAGLLGGAEAILAEGRQHPVETVFVGKGAPPLGGSAAGGSARSGADSAERLVAGTVLRALRETEGDVLVFLPGAAEIRNVRSRLEDAVGGDASHRNLRIMPLLGELEAAEQEAAIAPSPEGLRKVVLATNIAETSLTIEGVRVVVDSGLVRRAVFDPVTGMARLETQRISRASAEQRRGRAGRTAPGRCYRAWSEGAHRGLVAETPPEILTADLAPLALELASWGAADAATLRWLDPPPAALLGSARDLLRRLGALDGSGHITRHGREMAELAVHPRLAHMLLEGRELASLPLAAELAALLSDRDSSRGEVVPDADIGARLARLRGEAGGRRGAVERTRRFARTLERQLATERGAGSSGAGSGRRPVNRTGSSRSAASSTSKPDTRPADSASAGLLLAFAYPDRIGRRRPDARARYTLVNGRGAQLPEGDALAREEVLVAVELDDRGRDARIRLAAPLARADIEKHFAHELERADEVEWDARAQAVIARRTLRLGALLLEEKPLPRIPGDAARAAMLTGVRALGLDALPWTNETRDLKARVELVRRELPQEAGEWPALDDASLVTSIDEWLAPWLDGVTRREHLARLPLLDALHARLGWQRLRRLDELAPSRLEVPSGSRIRIDYRDENAPVVAVRLQEVFGLEETPRLVGGRVALTFKLLSPAGRPVQVTRDLASFWRSGYAEVRKDLRGRYPKHYWPENPREAEPSRGVRRRR